MKKGLTRFIFLIVFFIPVCWYLFIQLFGSNNFALTLEYPLDPACGVFEEIAVVVRADTVPASKRNYFERAQFGADKKRISFQKKPTFFFDCINQTDADLVLISDEGLWGSYPLSRDGVDRLLTEIDILLLQKNYGRGVDR